MQLAHSFVVPAAADRTWALLTDLEQVGGCFPGATVTEATDEEFSGTVKVKLGPIAMVYSGSGRFVLRDDVDHHAVIEAQGKDKRGNGTAGAAVTMQLLNEDGRTRVDVSTDLSVTGKPAQFGRGVMQDVSDKLLGRFVDCIEAHLGVDEDAGAPSAPGAAPEPEPEPVAPVVPEPEPVAPVVPEPEPVALRHRPVETDDAIDLGGAVGPVLLRRYAPVVGAAVVALVFGYLITRRRSDSCAGRG